MATSIRGFQVRSADLHVDRRRQAEVEHGVDEAAGLEVGGQVRQLGRNALADAVHVLVAADPVPVLQADLDEGGVRRRVAV